MPQTPEQHAGEEIDSQLGVAGVGRPDMGELNITAGRDIAVREFTLSQGYGTLPTTSYTSTAVCWGLRKARPSPESRLSPRGTATVFRPMSLHGTNRFPFYTNLPAQSTALSTDSTPEPRSRAVFSGVA